MRVGLKLVMVLLFEHFEYTIEVPVGRSAGISHVGGRTTLWDGMLLGEGTLE